MNQKWSEYNKLMQTQLKRKDSFQEGIQILFILREELMRVIDEYQNLSKEQLCAIPFMNAKGYHCKTIAYSIYHIFRIEDIVVNTLILNQEQVFFKENYLLKMHSPIRTTGNELQKQEIADFSNLLDLQELFDYAHMVNLSTKNFLNHLKYEDLKKTFDEKDKEKIQELNVVDKSAEWLIEYWCDKDIKGLIQMPLSRHWIMHIEACERIRGKITK